MKTIFATLSAAAIGATLLAPAYAAPAPATRTVDLTVTAHDTQFTLAAKKWGRSANGGFGLQSWDVNTAAGASFLALCIEPTVDMTQGVSLTYTADSTFKFADAPNGAVRQESIARLYGLYYDKITGTDAASKDRSLSFQLALWELYNDDATLATTATGNLAINNDKYRGLQNGKGAFAGADTIVTDAYTMLAAAQSDALYKQQYVFTKYSNNGSQDFVVAQAVPEPSTYAMLGLGLALVGFTARRRTKASQA